MFSRSNDPEEKARQKDQKKAQAEAKAADAALQKRRQEFWASPTGKARRAKAAGQRYFQVELDVDETARTSSSLMFGDVATETSRSGGQGAVLTDIEDEGWDLVTAGWVFQETGAVSRDKFLSTGQSVKTTGRTIGIYLFRADSSQPRTEPEWVGSNPEPTPPPPSGAKIWTGDGDDGLGDFGRVQ